MKARIILVILIGVLSLCSNRSIAQKMNSSLEQQIERNTKDTALNTKKGEYEVTTIILSGLAFIIASITLFYTYRTFKSQRVTQRNTTPIFTKDKQFEVIQSITRQVIDSFLRAGAIKIHLASLKKGTLLSEVNFVSNYIDVNELHLELFYNSSVRDGFLDETEYSLMSSLKAKISAYNWCSEIVSKHFIDDDKDYDSVIEEFDTYILRGSIDLLCKIREVSKENFQEKTDIRDEIVKYIWFRKNIYTARDDDGNPLNMIPQEEINKPVNMKELNNIYGIIEDCWGMLFEDYNFSKVLENENINFDNLYLLACVAMIGDKVLNERNNMIITFKPKVTKHTTTKTKKGNSST